MGRGSFDDLDLQALVDGELEIGQTSMLLEYLKHNQAAQMRHQQLLQQKALLQRWWQKRAPQDEEPFD